MVAEGEGEATREGEDEGIGVGVVVATGVLVLVQPASAITAPTATNIEDAIPFILFISPALYDDLANREMTIGFVLAALLDSMTGDVGAGLMQQEEWFSG